ncbi:MAG: Ku protein [Dehalococcoidia bacterium]|nr:Ku protein [Dehalococcoidia bacterium]MCB9490971.1 Ku protein [Dehalococcoidia bacterium]
MPRAIWRGAISFGMVSIPVKLYTATESHDVSFRQLAEEDLKPIKYLRWSPTLDREVQYGEIKKGYEYAKDQFVILEDEDFEGLPVPSKHTVAITQFVEQSEIDPVFFEKPYYLDPDEAGMKPYTLLLRAMEEKGLIAIGKLALRQKEQLVAIRPQDGHLTVEMLLYPDEVRPYEGTDVSDVAVSKEEMKMAFALIDMLHEPFDPSRYQDEYRDVLMNMITTKLEGGEVVTASEEAAPAQTVDLMAALRASIEATKSRKTGSSKAAAKAEADESDDAAESADDEADEAPKKKRSTAKSSSSTSTRSRKKTAAR